MLGKAYALVQMLIDSDPEKNSHNTKLSNAYTFSPLSPKQPSIRRKRVVSGAAIRDPKCAKP